MTVLNTVRDRGLLWPRPRPQSRGLSRDFKTQRGRQEEDPTRAGGPPTHRGDEPVQGLPSLCVLDRDGAEVVAEPDGRDDAARVAVGDVLLEREKRRG